MTRCFLNVTWNQTKSVLDYREKYYYTQTSGDPEVDKERLRGVNTCPDAWELPRGYGNATGSTDITQINMAGYSIWHQMNAMPRSWQAWQAMSQIAYLMFDEDMLTRYYAYNAYFYYFNDTDLVGAGVFGPDSSIAPNQQTAIYDDPRFGMGSPQVLQAWVVAADPDNPAHKEARGMIQLWFD